MATKAMKPRSEVERSAVAEVKAMPKKYILNLSGHPISEKKFDGRIVISVPVQLSLTGTPQDIMNEATEEIRRIWEALDDNVKKSAAAGLVAIVPPGLSWFALAFIAAWHAISGHFPKLYFWIRTEEGFQLIGPLDLQNIRDRWRWDRPYYIK